MAERLPCLATRQPAPAATKRGRGGDVEGRRARRRCRRCRAGRRARRRTAPRQRAHRAGKAGQLVHGLALRAQRDQERRGLGLATPSPSMISRRTARGLVGGEVRARRRAGRSPRVRTGLASARSRKLRSSACPASVRIDSGWNCTPSAGSSRWRIAHHHVARRGRCLEARRAGRGRRPASGSGRPRAGSRGPRRSSCRRARPRRSCRAPARRAPRGRRTPRPAPGARGRRRAPACPPRRTRRIASIETPASAGRARARARRRRGPARAPAARRRVAASLRTTSSSAPSSPRYWTRL